MGCFHVPAHRDVLHFVTVPAVLAVPRGPKGTRLGALDLGRLLPAPLSSWALPGEAAADRPERNETHCQALSTWFSFHADVDSYWDACNTHVHVHTQMHGNMWSTDV